MTVLPTVTAVIFTIAAGLGVVFNAYILFVLGWNRKRPAAANSLLLIHLASVNILFCGMLLSCFSMLGQDSSNSQPSGVEVLGALWSILPVIMIWTVSGMNCERYAAISTPLHYTRLVNTPRVVAYLMFAWAVAIALSLPPFFGLCLFSFQKYRWICTIICINSSTGEIVYIIIYFIMAFVVPLGIIISSNVHILLIARYHRHRIVTAIYEITLRAQATVTHQQSTNTYLAKYKGKNAMLTIIQLVGSIMVLNIPYFSVLAWDALTSELLSNKFVTLATLLLALSPPVNAYIYGVKSKALRQTLKILLQRHFYRKQAHKEVRKRMHNLTTKNISTLASRCRSLPPEEFRQRTPNLEQTKICEGVARTQSLPLIITSRVETPQCFIPSEESSYRYSQPSPMSIKSFHPLSKSLNDVELQIDDGLILKKIEDLCVQRRSRLDASQFSSEKTFSQDHKDEPRIQNGHALLLPDHPRPKSCLPLGPPRPRSSTSLKSYHFEILHSTQV